MWGTGTKWQGGGFLAGWEEKPGPAGVPCPILFWDSAGQKDFLLPDPRAVPGSTQPQVWQRRRPSDSRVYQFTLFKNCHVCGFSHVLVKTAKQCWKINNVKRGSGFCRNPVILGKTSNGFQSSLLLTLDRHRGSSHKYLVSSCHASLN